MIKVAMINTERSRGGAARVASALNTSVNTLSDKVSSTLYHSQDMHRRKAFCGLKRPGSRHINALMARLGGSTFVCDFGLSTELDKITAYADVLHLHNLHGYYLNWRYFLQNKSRRPIVWTLHDTWLFTGRCGAAGDCIKWKTGCGNCPSLSSPPAAWLDFSRKEYRFKSHLLESLEKVIYVSPSEWLAEALTERGVDERQIQVIANPVTSNFQAIDKREARKLLGLPQDTFTCLFIASDCNDHRKGYKDFLYATKPTSVTRLIVGTPPKQLEENTHYTGQVHKSDTLNHYYSASDLMVIPSYADNYPNTVVESLMSGTPVLGYQEGGIPAQLRGLPSCFTVPKGDLDGLREILFKLTSVKGKTKALSIELNKAAESRWNPSSVAEAYYQVYRKVLN